MAKFTKADEIEVPQSVGPFLNIWPRGSNLRVYEPEQGRDLLYNNPRLDGSTEVDEDNDKRIPLGTYTLNNRDYWENNNFNELTYQPYLTDNLLTHEFIEIETPDGLVIRTANDNVYDNPNQSYLWSIDALPFVINPNNDDIIHLDRYYDKNINELIKELDTDLDTQTTQREAYNLATEGKINFYLSPRASGRRWTVPVYSEGQTQYVIDELEQDNIDIFSVRGEKTRQSGKSFFDYLIEAATNDDRDDNDDNGFYLFKLNWGDGTKIEYTDKPKLLESTVLFDHFYEKPGFYTISGVVYQLGTGKIRAWEKFETNILLNPSLNYELNLFDYTNFASIGGISKDSSFVKSLYNMVGINPLTQDDERASEEVIEELNQLDKMQILNVLSKVDYEKIRTPYEDLIEPYSIKIELDEVAIQDVEDSITYNWSITNYNFNLTATVNYGFIDLTWNGLTISDNSNLFNTTSPDGWNVDWDNVEYIIESKYFGGDEEWYVMDTVSYDTETYNFNADSINYVENREYQFRIRIRAIEPDNNNYVYSYWSEMEEEGITTLSNEIGGLVNIIMSSTRDDSITPVEGSIWPLSSNTDDTHPNTLTITAGSPYGYEFLGWEILPPNTDTNVVYLGDSNALSTVVYWSNEDNSSSQDVINVQIHANYTTVETDSGGDVGVEIYPGSYGSVSAPDSFTLTSTAQTQEIDAFPQDDNDDFTYSFEKWEVQSGENNVGFGATYVSETSVKNTTLKWDNGGNNNNVSATVKAFFSREQITGGNGTGTCFLKGTMITMANKTTKPIEEIQVGDLVMSYDENTNTIVNNKVVERMFHLPEPHHISYGKYLIINNKIRVTTNHGMYVDTNGRIQDDGMWVIAKKIIIGDYLLDNNLQKVRVNSIETVNEIVNTFNFEVENTHTYIAENVVVHNIRGDGSGKGRQRESGGTSIDDLTGDEY